MKQLGSKKESLQPNIKEHELTIFGINPVGWVKILGAFCLAGAVVWGAGILREWVAHGPLGREPISYPMDHKWGDPIENKAEE